MANQTYARRAGGRRLASSRSRTATRSRARTARPRAAGAPKRTAASADRAVVQRLLDRFADAFTQGDGRAAADCFAYPSFMLMQENSQVLQDPETVARFFHDAPQQYQPKGIFDTRADIKKLDHLNDGLLLVHTHWPYFDEAGEATGDGESSVYVVRKEGRGKALIAVAIPLGVDSERGIDRGAAKRRRIRRST